MNPKTPVLGAAYLLGTCSLHAGTTYDTRLYIRVWDTEGSGRPLDLSFAHGAESDSAGIVPEDRPSLALGGGNDQQAYYLNYQFTAQATQLDIEAAVAPGIANSGSAHMYALSNHVAVPEPSAIALAGLGLLGALRRRRA
ncbi:MAG: PEP-CTERM sorting domain-containing protein [Akkermansiaceae bacterium]